MKSMKQALFLATVLAVLIVAAARNSLSDLVYMGPVEIKGTGFGNVTTILTMQEDGKEMKTGFESGCVGVDSSGATITGPPACEGNNVGGDEKPPAHFPHNSTPTVSDASQIVIVFNSDEPQSSGKTSISLDNLVMALFNSNGQAGFTSGNFLSPVDFSSTSSEPGIGNSGWAFDLTASEAAQAQAAIGAGYNMLGLSSTASGAEGGPETFFLESKEDVGGSAPGSAPEPASMMLFGTGLIALGGLVRSRRKHPKKESAGKCTFQISDGK